MPEAPGPHCSKHAFIPIVLLGLVILGVPDVRAQGEIERDEVEARGSMEHAPVPGGALEYEVRGDGEPVLLIHGSLIAGSFVPLMDEPALAGYRLIRYHRRGFAGSAELEGEFSIEQQAADARTVLRHLDLQAVHVVGHSYGAVTALQLAFDAPDLVHSLVLLEPPMMHLLPDSDVAPPSLAPAIEAYEEGDTLAALETFGHMVGGPEWKAYVAGTVPGGVEQATRDGWTFFEVELPALARWGFDAGQAARVSQPILFVRGSEGGAHYEEVGNFVDARFPDVERRVVRGVNHLLQMQDPGGVSEVIADFLARHPLSHPAESRTSPEER